MIFFYELLMFCRQPKNVYAVSGCVFLQKYFSNKAGEKLDV